MAMYLYMRVSLDRQDLDNQEHELGKRYPHGIVYKEVARSIYSRPKLEELLKIVQPGDMIAVAALDRLGRKTSEILKIIEDLQSRKVSVISIRENMDYLTPTGRMVTQMLAAVAELERSLISMRTKAALQAKKAAGVKLGRPLVHSPEMIALAHKMREDGHTFKEINAATKISTGRLSRMFQKQTEPAA